MLNKKWISKNLKTLGFKNVKSFQLAYDLAADGIYGVQTDKKLQSECKKIKNKLRRITNVKMINNSLMGAGTIKAIKVFQKKYKLKIDGIMGVKSRKKLYSIVKAEFKWQNLNGSINWNKVPYFKKSEFKCGCKGKYCKGYNGKKVDPYLLNMLINIRKKYGSVVITSGIRCKKYNTSLAGSSSTSRHMSGKAADIYVKNATKSQVMNLARKQKRFNYTYSNNTNMGQAVHVDVK